MKVLSLFDGISCGRVVGTWRFITTGQTKEEAIERFNKLSKI